MYSIWLTFEAKAQDRLRDTIQKLSVEFGSPNFEPHITLVGEIEWPPEEIISVCNKLLQGVGNQVVQTKAIGGNRNYFMALYFEVELPDRLNLLRHDLAQALLTNPNNVDPAHLSLVYANVNPVEQLSEEVRRLLSFVDNRLTANKIEIVESSRSIPINQWRVVTTIALNSSN